MSNARIDRLEILVQGRERRALQRTIGISAIAVAAMAVLIGVGIARLGSFHSEVASLGAERRQAEEARDEARSTVAERDKRIADLEAQLRQSEEARNAQLRESEDARKAQDGAIADRDRRFGELDARFRETEDTRKAQESTIAERDKRVAELEAQLGQTEEARSGEQSQSEETRKAQEAAIAERDKRIADLDAQLRQSEETRTAQLQESENARKAQGTALAERDKRIADLDLARQTAAAEAERLTTALGTAQSDIGDLKRTVAQVESQLRRSAGIGKRGRNVAWSSKEFIAKQPAGIGEMLGTIARLRADGAGWGLANRPGQGFRSDGFAGYVLQQLGVLPAGEDPDRALERLERSAAEPRAGDLALYAGGYTMFYFRDSNGKPFVLGLTPAGITALDPDFGVERQAVLAVPIDDRVAPPPAAAEAPPAVVAAATAEPAAPAPAAQAPAAPSSTEASAPAAGPSQPASLPPDLAAVAATSALSAAAAPVPSAVAESTTTATEIPGWKGKRFRGVPPRPPARQSP